MTEPPTSADDGYATLIDTVFVIISICYTAQVLTPIPMTYLSEIAFPFDLCVKLASSTVLFIAHAIHWMLDVLDGHGWHSRGSGSPAEGFYDCHAFIDSIAWGSATAILWMEHRRSRPPSIFLRIFWITAWLEASFSLFSHQNVTRLDITTNSTLTGSLAALIYSCSAVLAISCFFPSTPVTSDLVVLPQVSTPSAYLRSWHRKPPLSGYYGSFGNFGGARGVQTSGSITTETYPTATELTTMLSHSATNIKATIPSSTTSIWGKKQFVSYKIVVQTEEDQWTLRREYNDFATVHDELPSTVRAACPLPEDQSKRKFLSWNARTKPMKVQLEQYLRRVLSFRCFEPHSSQALCDFLEMEYLDDASLRTLYGDVDWTPQ
ncbi:hypothetical protein Poli38472_006009 [Pythium oligandrum]|uniref:PX domain-containing protein n=1 Tax=Pythium oligandrum TaxID=41045 RepID=A0A8K1CRL8_PYTOL|nr:hypothetical protein Poli38472_006009 [Pythium oligandrum]|eukprot:TMW68541.1 hypothetical protein Poli38472_006009 [Pythium oligandrum]